MVAQDRAGIDSIAQKLLDEVSLEPGEKMDTAAIRMLFHPQALISVLNPGDGNLESVNLEEFLEFLTDPSYEQGFKEWEVRKEIQQFQGIANLWQAFRGKAQNGPEIQGINSYQMVWYKERWWIHSLLWTFDDGRGLDEAFN